MENNFYTIKELKEMLNLSKSQVYKLLKNESGIIERGVKKYNEVILFSLMYKKIKRKRNGL